MTKEEILALQQYAGKMTARLARLSYKVTEVLEVKDKELSDNGYDLQNQFRQGFMLAQSLVVKAIDSLPDTEYATQEKQGWVKTLEAKPEREDNFLVITRGTRCIRAFSDDEFIDADGIVITKQISHWRELPQKPEV